LGGFAGDVGDGHRRACADVYRAFEWAVQDCREGPGDIVHVDEVPDLAAVATAGRFALQDAVED
jgi:hypothetical protein